MKLGGSLLVLASLPGCGGGPAFTTDKGWCDAACATLLACGVQGIGDQPTCSANCQAPADSIFLACAKLGNPSDCNSMALCTLKQVCGGNVPAGTNSCQITATCEANCNFGDVACGCACISAMNPSKAKNIVLNNNCVFANCSGCGNPTSCSICFNGRCSAQIQQCQNN